MLAPCAPTPMDQVQSSLGPKFLLGSITYSITSYAFKSLLPL